MISVYTSKNFLQVCLFLLMDCSENRKSESKEATFFHIMEEVEKSLLEFYSPVNPTWIIRPSPPFVVTMF